MNSREEIIAAVQEIGEAKKKFQSADIASHLKENSPTPQYLSTVLKELVMNRQLLKEGGGRFTVYLLPKYADLLANSYHKKIKNEGHDEYEFMQQQVVPRTDFLQKLAPNARKIFNYAFIEMLNNAFEHSKSKYIDIEVLKSGNNLIFTITDHGIGVFRNVKEQKQLNSEIEAMQDLMEGKTTTMPERHSGEGIFFTSKVSDVFILESYGLRLHVDNLIDDYFYEELSEKLTGTKVTFIMSLDTDRTIEGTFMNYATDPEEGGFDKTIIRVRLYAGGSIYVSRSQGRRIMEGLADKFKTIILDFDKVDTVGQAFADQVFRVFKLQHPEVEVLPINMNEVIKFMVERVEKPKA